MLCTIGFLTIFKAGLMIETRRNKTMIKQSYQTETVESASKDYVLVFVKNDSFILNVQKIIKTNKEKTDIIDAEKPSTGEKTKAIRVYPANDIVIQDLKYFIKEVLSDGDVLTMRGYLMLMKRHDILEDYDRVIMGMEKNEWEQNLVDAMQKLLEVILADLTANRIISSINQICENFTPNDNETFIAYEKTMALFNAINKYILACANNTIIV